MIIISTTPAGLALTKDGVRLIARDAAQLAAVLATLRHDTPRAIIPLGQRIADARRALLAEAH